MLAIKCTHPSGKFEVHNVRGTTPYLTGNTIFGNCDILAVLTERMSRVRFGSKAEILDLSIRYPLYPESGHRPHDGHSTEVRPACAQRDRRPSAHRQTGRHSAAVKLMRVTRRAAPGSKPDAAVARSDRG